MKKLTLITVMVVLLAIINACLLIFLWMGRPQREGRPTGGYARDYLVKELHLSEAQTQQYDSLRKAHHEAVMDLQQQERNGKEGFFATLGSPVIDSVAIDSMAAKNAASIAMIDKITYYHFRQVRAMLMPAQQQQFDAVIQNALRMMKLPPGAMDDGLPPGPGRGEGPPPAP